MPPQRKPRTADEKANEALDRATAGKSPVHTTLAFLLNDNEPPDPSARRTPPPPEPVREANPSAQQTRPQSAPVAVADAAPRPERTGTPAEPVRVTNGYTMVTNHLLDDVLPTLEPPDQAVLVRLYRLTRGHKKSRCNVSRNKLIAKTGVKKTRLLESLSRLEERGYIRRLPDDTANPNVAERGMIIDMLLEGAEPVRPANPSAQRTRPPGEPIKEKDLKENIERATDPAEVERLRAELEREFPHLREGKS